MAEGGRGGGPVFLEPTTSGYYERPLRSVPPCLLRVRVRVRVRVSGPGPGQGQGQCKAAISQAGHLLVRGAQQREQWLRVELTRHPGAVERPRPRHVPRLSKAVKPATFGQAVECR